MSHSVITTNQRFFWGCPWGPCTGDFEKFRKKKSPVCGLCGVVCGDFENFQSSLVCELCAVVCEDFENCQTSPVWAPYCGVGRLWTFQIFLGVGTVLYRDIARTFLYRNLFSFFWRNMFFFFTFSNGTEAFSNGTTHRELWKNSKSPHTTAQGPHTGEL